MSEILHIKNFGPIKDIKLDLRKFNVIIGENATGKSTIAKVLAMCRYFSYIIHNSYSEQPFEEGLQSRGLDGFIQNDTWIFYDCIHYSFTIKRITDKVPGHDEGGSYYEYDVDTFDSTLEAKSNEFKNLLNELENIRPKQNGNFDLSLFMWEIPTSFFLNDVSRVMDNPFYLPTERGLQSIFSLGKSSIQNISDSLFNQFADLDLIAKNFKNEIIIEPLDILYKNDNGHGYIKKNTEEKFYSLYNGASGYKSAIPIVLVIKYYSEIRRKQKTFLIEEPELNLFPKVQQELMNYLVAETVNKNNQVLLTTHSPYTLTSLNNLMYAFEVGKKKYEEVNKIIESKCWVSPDNVSAYMLLPDGTCEAIMDREENLIRAEKIDNISGFLNEQFDALLNIELIEK